jgi:hypothetical protein
MYYNLIIWTPLVGMFKIKTFFTNPQTGKGFPMGDEIMRIHNESKKCDF